MTHRCTITCSEPGCKTPITYDAKAESVPLYCEKHRTPTGRHAEVRILQRAKNIEPLVEWVIMICPKCKKRQNQLKDAWLLGEPVKCTCGVKMIYHKDFEPVRM